MNLSNVADGVATGRVSMLEESVREADVQNAEGVCRKACRVAGKSAFEGVEGIWLLLTRPYVFGIFWVSYATLMPRTITDYQTSVLIVNAYPSKDDQVAIWGKIGIIQNCLTAVLTLLGTRGIVQLLGVGGSLIVLPITSILCMLALCAHYEVWTSAIAGMVSSTIAYGLNSPTKEMLYVRTSREIKYKAKGWSEMYGNQLIKLFGAQVNLWVNDDKSSCRPNCFHPLTTLVICSAWVVVWSSHSKEKVSQSYVLFFKAS